MEPVGSGEFKTRERGKVEDEESEAERCMVVRERGWRE